MACLCSGGLRVSDLLQYSNPWVPWAQYSRAVLNPLGAIGSTQTPGCHGQPSASASGATAVQSIAPLSSSIARSESSRYKAAELWARLSMLLASHQLYHNQVRHSSACMRIAVLAHSVCKRVRDTHMNGPALACRHRS